MKDPYYYTYGLVSISGFLKPFFTILENIGFIYPNFLINIQHVFEVEKTIKIGLETQMNAYVSLFYYFFYEGGYIGIFLGMFIYGVLGWIFFRKSHNFRGVVYYSLFAQGLLFSMIRLQFTISHYCLAFLMIAFLMKKTRYCVRGLKKYEKKKYRN